MSETLQIGSVAARRADTGVYVHVPFCARSCDFCAFYQIQPRRDAIRRYLEGLEREARLEGVGRPASTCFVGGGTPSVLHERDLDRLCGLLLDHFGGGFDEWTVEVAPGSVRPEKLRRLRDCGVTRISMGVQSFQPALLEALGRPHSADQARRAYDWIREAGFASVNLDLIFAVPGQDAGSWRSDLETAVNLGPDHLSTYCLTFEEDTALYLRLSEGAVVRDEDRERDLYLETWHQLEAAGYRQYEVSNFARPGHECIHNLNTWKMGEWVGLGPAAASQQDGWRGANPPDLEAWLRDLAGGGRGLSGREAADPLLLAEDALIFGLRLREGVDLPAWTQRFPGIRLARLEALLASLEDEGLLERPSGGRLRLTEEGLLVCDAVGADLMGLLGEPEAIETGVMPC